METCVLCKIAENQLENYRIFENEYAVAFLDNHPINPGHILVIPKKHVSNFYDLDDDYLCEVMKAVRQMAQIIDMKIKPKKVGLIAAGWDIAHTHFHVVPMKEYHDITSKSLLEGKISNPTKKELEEIAQKLTE